MLSRRESLRLVSSGLLLSSAWSSPLLAARRDDRPAALLLPLTGPRGAIGSSMRAAATLAEKDARMLAVFDTRGTPEGAAAAARAAMKGRPGVLLGPLLGPDVRAAAAAVRGQVPIVAFSNDPVAATSGTFLFGITASQVTGAVLAYARSRGVRRVTVVGDGSPWAKASAAAAAGAEAMLGLSVSAVEIAPGAPLPPIGEAPDAVLVPGGGAGALAAARALAGTGVQMLATVQALDHRPDALAALEGVWLASPDPDAFATFARAYEARHGGSPGALAALAYDAAGIAARLRTAGQLNREGLLAEAGFECVTGPVRFRTDGSCARELAILVARAGGYEKVATSRGA